MTAPKRIALAFACMVLSIAFLGMVSVATIALRSGISRALPTIEALPVFLLFAFPGWILVLPFILYFKDADKWRGWATLVIGAAIGPLFLLTWALLASHGSMSFQWQRDGYSLVMSLIIGFLTTGFYVLLLWRSTKASLPNTH